MVNRHYDYHINYVLSVNDRQTIQKQIGGIILLSNYGKVLRKIRIDKGLTMAQMAKAIGITSAYLSTIERGKRNIPKSLTQDIIGHYELSNEQVAELRNAECLSMDSVEVDISSAGLHERILVLSLAKNLKNMTYEQIEMIKNIMEGN